MSTTTIRPLLDPTDSDYHPTIDPAMNELLPLITPGRPYGIGMAADNFADAVVQIVSMLYEDETKDRDNPAVTAETIGFVDEALGVLRSIRSRAIEENRRRMDAAMDRSAKLLGLDREEDAR